MCYDTEPCQHLSFPLGNKGQVTISVRLSCGRLMFYSRWVVLEARLVQHSTPGTIGINSRFEITAAFNSVVLNVMNWITACEIQVKATGNVGIGRVIVVGIFLNKMTDLSKCVNNLVAALPTVKRGSLISLFLSFHSKIHYQIPCHRQPYFQASRDFDVRWA